MYPIDLKQQGSSNLTTIHKHDGTRDYDNTQCNTVW